MRTVGSKQPKEYTPRHERKLRLRAFHYACSPLNLSLTPHNTHTTLGYGSLQAKRSFYFSRRLANTAYNNAKILHKLTK